MSDLRLPKRGSVDNRELIYMNQEQIKRKNPAFFLKKKKCTSLVDLGETINKLLSLSGLRKDNQQSFPYVHVKKSDKRRLLVVNVHKWLSEQMGQCQPRWSSLTRGLKDLSLALSYFTFSLVTRIQAWREWLLRGRLTEWRSKTFMTGWYPMQ